MLQTLNGTSEIGKILGNLAKRTSVPVIAKKALRGVKSFLIYIGRVGEITVGNRAYALKSEIFCRACRRNA
jgi:hypothetical protein